MQRLNQSSSNAKNLIKYHGNIILFHFANIRKYIETEYFADINLNEYLTPDTAANLPCRNCSFR